MTEGQLQAAVIELAELLGWRVFHNARSRGNLRSHTSVGFPDLVLCHRSHGTRFVELKAARGTVSEDQKAWGRDLIAAGQKWYCFRQAQWLDGTVERVLRGEA